MGTLRLLQDLGLSAGDGCEAEWLQKNGRAALEQLAGMYGASSGTSCFVHREAADGDSESRTVCSGDDYAVVNNGLVAVPIRVRRDTDAEFVALSQLLARRHWQCRASD